MPVVEPRGFAGPVTSAYLTKVEYESLDRIEDTWDRFLRHSGSVTGPSFDTND
jgi:hypothetical protein